MLRFIGLFLIIISLYHFIISSLVYGLLWGQHSEIIMMTKEIIRWIAVTIFALLHFKDTKKYFQKRKSVWIILLVLLIYAITISLFHDKTRYNILVGLKYNFHFLWVFLSASLIGFLFFYKHSSKKYSQTKQENTLQKNFPKIIFYSQYALVSIILLGFLAQILKFTNPGRFTKIGFGPIGDFVFGQNPPIYYRTGPGGIPRRQGIFSWPNNYGYFLIAFLPLALLWRKTKLKSFYNILQRDTEKLINLMIIILFLTTIVLTLSRTALIWAIVVGILLYRKRLSKHKKITITFIIIAIFAFLGLSFVKKGSSKEHLQHKLQGIHSIIQEPLGYGLWTAGPAIFHGWTLLPENYYLQVMADIGSIGFLIWIFLLFQILKIFQTIQIQFQKPQSDKDEAIFLHRKYLQYGRSALLIMGLFLQVFEDSMVNYLFFIPFGLLSGYLSAISLTKALPIFKDNQKLIHKHH